MCGVDMSAHLLPCSLSSSKTLYAGHVNSKHCLFASFGTTDQKGKWILSGSEDNSIHIWHLNTRAVRTCQLPQGHTCSY